MQTDALDEPVAKSTTPTFLDDEHVGEIGVRGEVGDGAGEADLALILEQPEGDRTGDGALDDVARNSLRPVGGAQDAMDEVDVEPRSISGDDRTVAPTLVGNVVHEWDRAFSPLL